MMLSLTFSDTLVERPIRDKHDLLLAVGATFRLSMWDRVVYQEATFPIVELRVALERWISSSDVVRQDFEFESMESDESDLVWFRCQSDGRWRVGSVHQDGLAPEQLALGELLDACHAYIESVDAWVRRYLEIEIRNYLDI
jgi:hypothetical protein